VDRQKLSDSEIRALYERHGSALIAYACSLGLDVASAQDIVQKLFLKLLEGQTLAEESATGYLYRAVRNACFNQHRDRAKDVPLETAESWLSHRNKDREAELTLQRALSELPEEQSQVVIMRVWGGMTLEEIAAATDVSLNTAASRYRYAIEKLQDIFEVKKRERTGGR